MTSGLTVNELSVRQRVHPNLMQQLLLDEQRRGHVELGGGRWHATESFVARFGDAFRTVHLPERTP